MFLTTRGLVLRVGFLVPLMLATIHGLAPQHHGGVHLERG